MAITETLKSGFTHLTANSKPWFAVSCYPSAHIWDLSFASGTLGSHVFFHSFAQFYSLKRGTVMLSGTKNLAVNQSPLERGLRTSTSNCKLDGKALVTWLLDVCGSREMSKNLDLYVSYIVALVWPLRRKKKAWNIGILIHRIDNSVFLLVYVVLCQGKARKCLGLSTALVNPTTSAVQRPEPFLAFPWHSKTYASRKTKLSIRRIK